MNVSSFRMRSRATSSSADPNGRASAFSGRTAWARNMETPLREFLRTETGGAAVLLAAAVAALVWVNVDASSYDSLWGTTLSIDLGGIGHLARSSPLGEQRADDVVLLRRRARSAPRVRPRASCASGGASRCRSLAGIGGMAVAVAIYLAFNAGQLVRAGLGDRDVDRHRFRARPARARRPALSRPPAGVHAHGRRRRRHRRAGRHRDRLHGDARPRAGCSSWPGACSAPSSSRAASASGRGLVYCVARGRRLGGAARVGSRAGRRRPRDGPARLRLSAPRGRSSSARRSGSGVPRAAHAGAGARAGTRASDRRSRRTSACSSSSTRGRAT